VSDKYAFIAAERADNSADAPTTANICTWLDVSKSGFYDWLRRPPSAGQRRRELLTTKICALFEACGRTLVAVRAYWEMDRAAATAHPI